MADPRHAEPSVSETTTEARAGSTPGVARNVLVSEHVAGGDYFRGDRLGRAILTT